MCRDIKFDLNHQRIQLFCINFGRARHVGVLDWEHCQDVMVLAQDYMTQTHALQLRLGLHWRGV